MRTIKDFPYQHVLVLGLARSGTAIAKLLLASNIKVTINDRSKEQTEEIKNFTTLGAKLVLGSHPSSVLDGIHLIVKNPGIPYDHELLTEAMDRGIPIYTDIEFVQHVFSGPIVAITGSNGKTTTTRLIEEMLSAGHVKNTVAGNIGVPVSEVAPFISEENTLILELSSFQLLGTQTFKPRVSVLLNIYDAHLDYHKTRKNYELAKYKIFENQDESDYLVYNLDDKSIKESVKRAKGRLIPFSQKERLNDGVWTNAKSIFYQDELVIDKEKIVIAGSHHLENILAAVGVAKIYDVSNEAIEQVLTSFHGVKHRLQFVTEIDGRRFYNDSKATNMLATIKALQAFDHPIILLAGGLDRGDDFKALQAHLSKVKHIIAFGENAEKIMGLAKRSSISAEKVSDVEEATNIAFEQSKKGDVILLSPASASWDQFKSFEERGDMFINTVHKLN